ncbi:MAG: hypothetical protein WDN75_04215 [Bacteroidota bacterium]
MEKYGSDAAGAGHGGMDWFVLNAFIESAKLKIAPPQDVYDAVTECNYTFIGNIYSNGGASVAFPDFTQVSGWEG